MRAIWFLVLVGCGSSTTAAVKPAPAPPAGAAVLDQGLLPAVQIVGEPERHPLEVRMRELGVPAVSIAVFDNYELKWTRAYGLADVEAGTRADEHTLFLAGSISKSVNALAHLKFGQIPLDAPINDSLASWKLPDNDFTRAKPVTLRMLLSHTGGVTVHGFRGYAPGEALPTIAQILNGAAPANNAPVRVDIEPGSKFRYAGGGTTISQLALVERSGKPYPQIVNELVLEPLGMTSSSFEQVLTPARLQHAAVGYDERAKVIQGKRFSYPEMAAAGLWTTPADLARMYLEIGKAHAGKSKVITKTIADLMTTKVKDFGSGAGIGLGVFLFQRGSVDYFGHGGADVGFQADALASLDGGRGVVIMTNSESGLRLIPEISRTIFAAYGWPGADVPVARFALDAAGRARFVGRYAPGGTPYEIVDRNGTLFGRNPFGASNELVPIAADEVVDRSDAKHLRLDANGLQAMLKDEPTLTVPRVAEAHPLFLLEAGNIDGAVAALKALKDADAEEGRINQVGYDVMGRDVAQAARILQLNTLAFPDSANAHDSYADALTRAGKLGEATAMYQRVLLLLPTDARLSADAKDGLRKHAEGELTTLRAKH
ncbi:MAG TPA: serine hydrolase domain-containing protein [Kofleriaceae bacterium]|nr:serine hydrolase domain-containing protein [Kofleriaceae bacterium]